MDYLFILILMIHGVYLTGCLRYRTLTPSLRGGGVPFARISEQEFLLFLTLVFFLFSYIYASNANMDYVQRYAQRTGNIRLAPDSRSERGLCLLKYGPFLIFDTLILLRLVRRRGCSAESCALFLTVLAAVLYAFAFPSFVSLEGWWPLAYLAYAPLFMVLRRNGFGRGVFFGVVFGIVGTMLHCYWLGTFSLISLQLLCVIYTGYYAVLLLPLHFLKQRYPRKAWLLLPIGFVIFDYVRTLGFLGYPWGIIGTSQYSRLALMQLASLGGIWLLDLLVLLINSLLTEGFLRLRARERIGWPVPLVLAVLAPLIFLWGNRQVEKQEQIPPAKTVRVALVQQNTDPRKAYVEENLEILKTLTDAAMHSDPDLIAWSETAFVPNIRRWSQPGGPVNQYTRMVDSFLRYQQSLDTWLLTGNDDYDWYTDADGKTVYRHYNASVLFDDKGQRNETYRKIHLVPFSESFPYRETLPRIYDLLLNFDVHLWEKGSERTIFRHPEFTFSTPICFEDNFPADIRKFAAGGIDMLINLSNDFWSLTEVEAQQHFANAVFRAVENRLPLLRSTASGITCYVNPAGRVVDRLPCYEAAYMIADVAIADRGRTLYARLGEWVIIAAALGAMIIILFEERRRREISGY